MRMPCSQPDDFENAIEQFPRSARLAAAREHRHRAFGRARFGHRICTSTATEFANSIFSHGCDFAKGQK
jgi:hypothetical protein